MQYNPRHRNSWSGSLFSCVSSCPDCFLCLMLERRHPYIPCVYVCLFSIVYGFVYLLLCVFIFDFYFRPFSWYCVFGSVYIFTCLLLNFFDIVSVFFFSYSFIYIILFVCFMYYFLIKFDIVCVCMYMYIFHSFI